MKRSIITTAAFLGVAVLAVPAVNAAKPEPKNLTIGASANTIKFGGTVTLSGKLNGSNNSGRQVMIEQDPFPVDAFANAGTATTNATGDWSSAQKPTANTRYRARSGNADSKTVDVMVRPAISLTVSDRTPRAGSRVRFSGQLCPEHDGVAIALQRRFGTKWRTLRKPVLKDIPGGTCSSYSKRLRVRKDGVYRMRFLGDADHVAGNSRGKRLPGPSGGGDPRAAMGGGHRRRAAPAACQAGAVPPAGVAYRRASRRRFGRRVRAAA